MLIKKLEARRHSNSKNCTVWEYEYPSEDLIKKNLFGLHKPHKMLKQRIGDYILIMKDKYIIRDRLFKEERIFLRGNHGGLSKEEMYVPLMLVESN